MALVSMLSVLAFDAVLCAVEVPKMLKEKLFREMAAFFAILAAGTAVAFLKALGVELPGVADLLEHAFSPVSGLMKSLLQPGGG